MPVSQPAVQKSGSSFEMKVSAVLDSIHGEELESGSIKDRNRIQGLAKAMIGAEGMAKEPDDGGSGQPLSFWQRAKMSTLSWMNFIRQHPHVAICPAVLLSVLVTAGVIGVMIISNTIEDNRKDNAYGEGISRAQVISQQLHLASVPISGLYTYVMGVPGHEWEDVLKDFSTTSSGLISLLEGSTLDERMVLQLQPSAVISASYPQEGNEGANGIDVLRLANQRPMALAAIEYEGLFAAGPYMLNQGYQAAILRKAVFLDAKTYPKNYTFNNPNNLHDCPEDLCYTTKRFWGFCGALIFWDVIRDSANIHGMKESGYDYRLTRPPQGLETNRYVIAESEVNVTWNTEPVVINVTALSSMWELRLVPQEGHWYSVWRDPMIAAVVVASFVISVLVALVLGSNVTLKEKAADLKAKSEEVEGERNRLKALLVRQFELLECFNHEEAIVKKKIGKVNKPSMDGVHETSDVIESLRMSMIQQGAAQVKQDDQIELLHLLGSGAFGKVYRGLWRGSSVAVKCMVMPAGMSRSIRAEKMAVMEAAVSSSMCHPHLVQTYTYSMRPLRGSAHPDRESSGDILSIKDSIQSDNVDKRDDSADVHGYEVRLVLEFCDGGDLQQMWEAHGFMDDEGFNYGAVLETAADVAKGMMHLHYHNILHSDLKASNVMFKSGRMDGRGFVAKVVDFGLAIQLDDAGTGQTHVSKMFQGTMTHMAPEVLMDGKQSKAADVYAFGILMFELSGQRPYEGIKPALLGHLVCHDKKRPCFSSFFSKEYKDLAARCWDHDPAQRPTFQEVVKELECMQTNLGRKTRPLKVDMAVRAKTAAAKKKKDEETNKLIPRKDFVSIDFALSKIAALILVGDGSGKSSSDEERGVLTSIRSFSALQSIQEEPLMLIGGSGGAGDAPSTTLNSSRLGGTLSLPRR